MDKKFLFLFILLITGLSFGLRFLPHIPNFTPIGALALFIGAYAAKKYQWSLCIPLAAMFVSDLFIGFYDLKLMAVVYASFFAYSLVGVLVIKRKTIATVLCASAGGALLFYLATNFAVWAFSSWYPHNFSGLMLSYALALPFFKYTILGDIVFSGIFFGTYELASAYFFGLRKQKQTA